MIVLLSLLVCVIGCLVYALAANPKLQELGRIAFFAGLLAFLLHVDEAVRLLNH
jgi:Na+/phosphate symporter